MTYNNGQGISPETSNTTIQVSNNSNVYSTIEQRASIPDNKIFPSSSNLSKKFLLGGGGATSDEKRYHPERQSH